MVVEKDRNEEEEKSGDWRRRRCQGRVEWWLEKEKI